MFHLCFENSTPPHLQFFHFLYTTILASFSLFSRLWVLGSVSPLFTLDFWDANHDFLDANYDFFLASVQRKRLWTSLRQLWKKAWKGASPSFNGWDSIPNSDGWDESVNMKNNCWNHGVGITKYFSFLIRFMWL